ncbi:MAG: exonuclease SbcCD subunit D [Pseudomonadales bacterium]|nr:exonuclease SbcCD subunit D [Pseudomonadales bacterium]NRA17791.1 exonuclease SbcCD subunit D [Oceanospirillaceae bacterium]
MRFLHTSDWHIGRSFHNVSLLQDQAFILEQIIDIARAEKVAAIVVAGDIYDRSVPPAAAVELLDQVVDKIIVELKIALIIIPGNHDSAQRLGFASRQLQYSGLYILGNLQPELESVVLTDEHGEVAFWGMPYADPAAVRSAFKVEASSHDQAIKVLCETAVANFQQGQRNVALSHCFIDGSSESDSERPLSIGGADRVDWQHFSAFDYVALGHLHGRQFKGRECIRYSGSILKYSFSEEQQIKSVVIVDMGQAGECEIHQVALQPLRNMRSITGELKQILERAEGDPNRHDYLLIKLTDSQAILDVMGKLRALYPNILHLERPGLMALKSTTGLQPQQINANEMSMFGDFFAQVMDRELSKDESSLVQKVIEDLHVEEGGT